MKQKINFIKKKSKFFNDIVANLFLLLYFQCFVTEYWARVLVLIIPPHYYAIIMWKKLVQLKLKCTHHLPTYISRIRRKIIKRPKWRPIACISTVTRWKHHLIYHINFCIVESAFFFFWKGLVFLVAVIVIGRNVWPRSTGHNYIARFTAVTE